MVKDDEAAPIREEDVVFLNPVDGDEEDLMAAKMEARKARAKAEKKASKAEKRKDVIVKEEEPAKKVKKIAFSSQSVTKPKEVKTTKSIQEDKSKSEVYKSLFSSHSSAQNRPKGNWVTFDPRYN